jgi:hypothetical protein
LKYFLIEGEKGGVVYVKNEFYILGLFGCSLRVEKTNPLLKT